MLLMATLFTLCIIYGIGIASIYFQNRGGAR